MEIVAKIKKRTFLWRETASDNSIAVCRLKNTNVTPDVDVVDEFRGF